MIGLSLALNICLASAALTPADVVVTDTLKAAVLTETKVESFLIRSTSPVTTIYWKDLRDKYLESPKNLSSLVPNLHIPEYGSAMTSSIYVRGFGSRMENPSIALYVDDIPVLDKNMFDTDFLEVDRVDFLSGPQGSLFGRNAMVGVMSVATHKPFFNKKEVSASYGSGGTVEVGGLWTDNKLSISAKAFHTNGLYVNAFDGEKIDPGNGASVRLRYHPDRQEGRESDYLLWASWINQGGWPYRLVQADGVLAPVAYNDESRYSRLALLAGNVEHFRLWGGSVKNVLSLQLLGDKMTLDQDFTTASMFTLQQRQRQIAVTEEFIYRPLDPGDVWNSQSGIFLSSRYNRMHAPVHFLSDGVDRLILGNANANIPESIGYLDFMEDDFVIGSDFDLFYENAALYHESYFTFGKWLVTAGLRLDYEFQRMNYNSRSTVNYALLPRMPQYRELESVYKGNRNLSWLRVVPKLSVRYGDAGRYVYLTASEGFRAGGFNTQIFSDILQNRMKLDLMNGLGVHVDGMGEGPGASSTSYKPENSWNIELGGRTYWRSGRHRFNLYASVFDIECINQQITIFPEGNNTGRMMANAGKSRSYGLEASLSWAYSDYFAGARFGYSHATFREYNDRINYYSGKRIPYAPSATWAMSAGRDILVFGDFLNNIRIELSALGTGKTWWNEDNSLSQGAYLLLGADVTFNFDNFDLFIHGTNILNKDYNVFCFKSVGNTFMQKGRPRCITAGIRIKLF